MKRLREKLAWLWNLRHDPSPPVRIGWWTGLFSLLLLLAASSSVLPAANTTLILIASAWLLWNLFRGMQSFFWCVFHPSAMLPARRSVLRWAFWITLFSSLALYSNLETLALQNILLHSSVFLFIGFGFVILFPFIFFLMLALSLQGACIGAFMLRRHPDAKETVPLAVSAWWLSLLISGIAMRIALACHLGAARNVEPLMVNSLLFSAPQVTVWIVDWMRRSGYEPRRIASLVVSHLLSRLIWRWKDKRGTRTLDLRGATLGLCAAALIWAFGSPLLAATQESILASFIRARFQIAEGARRLRPDEAKFPDIIIEPEKQAAQELLSPLQASAPGKVVLLRMDAPTRAAALTNRSETAIQAEVIQRLSALGARRIVLPLPTLNMQQAEIGATTQEAVTHSQQDLLKLITAVRQAGNILLVVPARAEVDANLKPLQQAAQEVGQFGLDTYGPAQMPMVTTQWGRYPPVPLLALAASRQQPLTVTAIPHRSFAVRIAGAEVPLCRPDKALLDFRADTRHGLNYHVPAVSYSALLKEKSLAPTQEPSSRLSTLFAGKVVFLEPLISDALETPIGVLPRYQALAGATNTLLNGQAVRRPEPLWSALWLLGIGALAGQLCLRRDPLEAIWRVACLVFVQGIASLFAFFVDSWYDPALPIVAAGCAFLIVTQLTFSLERGERNRNRELLRRFVAPQVAEEMLDAPEDTLKLGGDRRKVCILFADVRNFTGFTETHEPEEIIEAVNAYMTTLTTELFDHKGILDKYTGDGLVAMFPVTDAPQQEIAQAVRAALAMRDAAVALSAQRALEKREILAIGIGMHYGEAVVGRVGHPRRWDYTALGHTVVIAARLQGLAAGGEVVISEAVCAAVRGAFEVHEDKPVSVKGVSEPVLSYRVLASAPERPSLLP